jgi:hypothetical protein
VSEDSAPPHAHDRRTFLTTAAGAGVGAYLVLGELADEAVAAIGRGSLAPAIAKIAAPPPVLTLTWTARRREDALLLRFRFYNLVLSRNSLVRKNPNLSGYVVVEFPPQAVLEQAYHEGGLPIVPTPAPGSAASRIADPSRLAFLVPAAIKNLPFSLERLLDFSSLTPSLTPVAAYIPSHVRKPKYPAIRVPAAWETAIELPFRLALSPTSGAVWHHAAAPIVHGDFSELWRMRLGHVSAGTFVDGAPIRGVWTYDPKFNPAVAALNAVPGGNLAFLETLGASAREKIVRQTSQFNVSGRADVDARRLWLTSIGGTLEARGAWNVTKPANLNLTEWRHVATSGRDHYVKVVEKGHLFPFGHRTVLTTISERKFEPGPDGHPVAVIRQRKFLTVREPVRSYLSSPSSPGTPSGGRGMPFTSIRIATLVTPDLDPSGLEVGGGIPVGQAQKVHVGLAPFRFHMVGHDQGGQDVAFTSPAWFVQSGPAYDTMVMLHVRDQYNFSSLDEERTAAFDGVPITIAPASPGARGRTDVGVFSIRWEAIPPDGPLPPHDGKKFEGFQQPLVYPKMGQAAVRLPALEQASGGGALSPAPVIAFADAYLADEFVGANRGQLFAKMVMPGPQLTFGGGSSGGVMTPNLNIVALSRILGPIGGDPADLVTARNGTFDPALIFKGVSAKILGGLDLMKLIAKVENFDTNPESLAKALTITHEREGTVLRTHLHWAPDIIVDSDPLKNVLVKNPGFSFVLDASTVVDAAHPEAADSDVVGRLRNFSLVLVDGAPFIQLDFNELSFRARRGQKADTTVDIARTRFLGELAFIEKLQDLTDFSGDGGPKITVSPSGISADLKVALPNLQVGVFALSNMSLGAGFNLPFSGNPARFRFNFATREDMFHLQVSFLAGGGFVALALGSDGVERIEAAFEFGAMVALDIGVASGELHVMAGIYFSYGVDASSPTTDTCIITGYLRMGGSLDILGIVDMSVEFYMGLSYRVDGAGHRKVYGDASLTVNVHVLFFSKSVSMHVHRQFGNADGDPTFAQQFPDPVMWDDYCDAFAA